MIRAEVDVRVADAHVPVDADVRIDVHVLRLRRAEHGEDRGRSQAESELLACHAVSFLG